IFLKADGILADGGAGDDDIAVAQGIQLDAWLFGGAGNDRLKGGGGNNILVGGDGDDLLVGGQGRDILIGGFGSDRLVAGKGDDILISGRTDFDTNLMPLRTIMAEWASGRDYLT